MKTRFTRWRLPRSIAACFRLIVGTIVVLASGLVSSAAQAAPAGESAPSGTVVAPTPAQTNQQWLMAPLAYLGGINCPTAFTGGYIPNFVAASVGYLGDPNQTAPTVGDRFYGKLLVAVIGLPCSTEPIDTRVILPPNLQLGIDTDHRVFCRSSMDGTHWKDETANPAMQCRTQPVQDAAGAYNLGIRGLAQGEQIEIYFPLLAQVPLVGGVNRGLTGKIQSLGNAAGVMYPTQPVTVTAKLTPSVSYPVNPVRDLATVPDYTRRHMSGRTLADIANHHSAGQLYFDLGTTVGYGTTAGPAALSGDYDAYRSVYATWTNLVAGVTYHWRTRFVTAAGATLAGPDQTFWVPGYQLTLATDPPIPGAVQNDATLYTPGTETCARAGLPAGYAFQSWIDEGGRAVSTDRGCLPVTLDRNRTFTARYVTSPRPANDTRSTALDIQLGYRGSFNTANATDDSGEQPIQSCGGSGFDPHIGKTVWFRYRPTTSGSVGAIAWTTSYDAVVAMYRDNTLEGCGQATFESGDGAGGWFDVVAGNTYYIRVGGADGESGLFDFELKRSA